MISTPTGHLAIDLGAESGRAMLGVLDRDRVELVEAHRFANHPVQLPSGFHWDTTGLFREIVRGVELAGEAARERGVELVSVGVDTWGVDFGLIGRSGHLLGLPFCYRDARNAAAMARVLARVDGDRLYATTGIQPLAINTIFQLDAQREAEPAMLDAAASMMLMPDLLHHLLGGERVNEATIASTTGMVDARTGDWARDLLREAGLPVTMLGKLTPAGTRIGRLRAEVAEVAGVSRIDIIVPGSHDTASAVAAVPATTGEAGGGEGGGGWAYLSSGTWSLLGRELDEPILTPQARAAGFTNEWGVGGKVRFLKNIAGLWLVQQVRADLLSRGEAYEYTELARLAGDAEAFRTLIDPGHTPFASPGGMIGKLAAHARATRQPVPETPGQMVRACLESLALTYRDTLTSLESITGSRVDRLHLVGGGGRNTLLNQMTADAIGRPVLVGPFEATAVGNVLTQAIGRGDVKDLAHLRRIVAHSQPVQRYDPRDTAAYDAVTPPWQR